MASRARRRLAPILRPQALDEATALQLAEGAVVDQSGIARPGAGVRARRSLGEDEVETAARRAREIWHQVPVSLPGLVQGVGLLLRARVEGQILRQQCFRPLRLRFPEGEALHVALQEGAHDLGASAQV